MSLGSRIREARIAAKKTQAEVATHFGYDGQAVSNWERGKSQPSIEALVDLARFLDVSLLWLATGSNPNVLDAELYLVPLEDRELAEQQAKRVISKWIEKQ